MGSSGSDEGRGRGRGGEEDSAGPSAAMSLALRSPRSPSLNPLAHPYERATRGAVRGTPDWLRYSASFSSSLNGSQSRSPSAAHRKGKGKAVAMDISLVTHRSVPPCGGFMADARRRGPASGTSAGRPRPRMLLEREASDVAHASGRELHIPNISDEGPSGEGWVEVRRRRGQHRDNLGLHPAPRSVPVDLVGRCFNCFATDHVAAACRNPSRCLRCRREDHRSLPPTRQGQPILSLLDILASLQQFAHRHHQVQRTCLSPHRRRHLGPMVILLAVRQLKCVWYQGRSRLKLVNRVSRPVLWLRLLEVRARRSLPCRLDEFSRNSSMSFLRNILCRDRTLMTSWFSSVCRR
ncbi:hypothetical protein SEVIR_9G037201v4 [Setaria viridis]